MARRRGRPPHPDVLTPRQWQVLALIRQGLSNEQIAERLGISADGVKFHVSEILGKLGVTSRNEAARWYDERRERATASLHVAFGARKSLRSRLQRPRRDCRASRCRTGRVAHNGAATSRRLR